MSERRDSGRRYRSPRAREKRVRMDRPVVEYSEHVVCPSGKAWFRCEASAMARVVEIAERESRKPTRRGSIPVRSYLCQHCSGWHITSQPVALKDRR